jgi:hypothetical protein
MVTSSEDARRDEVFALPDDRDDDELRDGPWLDDPSYDRPGVRPESGA